MRAVTGVAAAVFAMNAWAVDPFTVRDIRIEGLQRVEPGTVFASMPIRVGEQYSDDKASAAIRALFGLGLFKDVRIEVSGDVLVVIVEERPTIADFSLCGYLFWPDQIGVDWNDYPNIRDWLDRIKLLPGWKMPEALMPSGRGAETAAA